MLIFRKKHQVLSRLQDSIPLSAETVIIEIEISYDRYFIHLPKSHILESLNFKPKAAFAGICRKTIAGT